MTSQPKWKKSSYSGTNGDCVEMADLTEWRTSTYSGANTGCVEVADTGDVIGIRDSKLGDDSPVLAFNRKEMRAFIDGVRAGEFDDLV